MKRIIFCLILLLLITNISIGCAGRTVYLKKRPPAVKVEVKPVKPFPNAYWIPGNWVWKNGKYSWKTGHWAKPRQGYVWIPGKWIQKPRGWVYISGHWKKR